MFKFKIGDRVVLLRDKKVLSKGAVGTVVEEDRTPEVEWDDFTGGHDGNFFDRRTSIWAVRQEDLALHEEGGVQLLYTIVKKGEGYMVFKGEELMYTTGLLTVAAAAITDEILAEMD